MDKESIYSIRKKISRKEYLVHCVFNTEPHLKSFASYLLLKEQYKKLDSHISRLIKIDEELRSGNIRNCYSNLRRKYLNRLQKKYGSLFCYFCGKKDLKISTKNIKELATIDHKIPVSRGGSKHDMRNFLCVCNSCNQDKKNKTLGEYCG